MDEFVRVDGRRAVIVRLDGEPVTCTLCDILCLYHAIRSNRVLPYGVGELWRIHDDHARGRCRRYDRIKSGGGRYNNTGVFGVENKISASQEDLSRGRHNGGGHCGEVGGLERGD